MKKIEAGCLVMIIGASEGHEELLGRVGEAGRRVMSNQTLTVEYDHKPSTYHSFPEPSWTIYRDSELFAFCEESSLRRIDDYDASEDVVTTDNEVSA